MTPQLFDACCWMVFVFVGAYVVLTMAFNRNRPRD